MKNQKKMYYLYFNNGIFPIVSEKFVKELISVVTGVPQLKRYKYNNPLKKGYEILNFGFQDKQNVTEFIVWGEKLSTVESCVELGLIPAFKEIEGYINDSTHSHAIAIQESLTKLSQKLTPFICELYF